MKPQERTRRILDCDAPSAWKIVLIAVADHMNEDDGNAYPGPACLSKETGLCERQVHQILRDLAKADLIQRVPRGHNDPPFTVIRWERVATFARVAKTARGGKDFPTKAGKDCHPGRAKTATKPSMDPSKEPPKRSEDSSPPPTPQPAPTATAVAEPSPPEVPDAPTSPTRMGSLPGPSPDPGGGHSLFPAGTGEDPQHHPRKGKGDGGKAQGGGERPKDGGDKPAKPPADLRWRKVTDLWSQRWKAFHPGQKYPWDIHQGSRGGTSGRDYDAGRRLVGTARVTAHNGEEALQELGQAMDLYIRDARAGTAFPRGEPPTLAQFAAQAQRYIQTARKPARRPEDDIVDGEEVAF